MKYLTLFVLAGLAAGGCNLPPEDTDTRTEKVAELKLESVTDEDVKIIRIEGCEYIVYKHHEGANLGYGFMAHKGNCKNPIHCYNPPPRPSDHHVPPADSLLAPIGD